MTKFNNQALKIRDYVIEESQPSAIESTHYLYDLRFDFEETDQVVEEVRELSRIDARAFALLTNFFIKCCQRL